MKLTPQTWYGHCPDLDSRSNRNKKKGQTIMLNGANGRQELERVNMFIRALRDEMAQTQAHQVESTLPNAVAIEMKEALYELRLRKLLISALVDCDLVADNTTSH